MKRLIRFCAVTALTLPMFAFAQTANTPGGNVSTGTPLDQTKGNPQATTPTTTSTTPTATNPAGALSKSAKPRTIRRSNQTPPGDAPTYPAPAKDGTPTK